MTDKTSAAAEKPASKKARPATDEKPSAVVKKSDAGYLKNFSATETAGKVVDGTVTAIRRLPQWALPVVVLGLAMIGTGVWLGNLDTADNSDQASTSTGQTSVASLQNDPVATITAKLSELPSMVAALQNGTVGEIATKLNNIPIAVHRSGTEYFQAWQTALPEFMNPFAYMRVMQSAAENFATAWVPATQSSASE